MLFWYNAVLKALPDIRDSIFDSAGGIFLNNRGLFLPTADFQTRVRRGRNRLACRHRRRGRLSHLGTQATGADGAQAPVFWVTLALVIGLPLCVLRSLGVPATFRISARPGASTSRGGIEVLPEFVALLFGLSVYTAAFIAEVVRAGILAVSRGQTEAAYSLGLRPGPTLRLIVVPQAMRVIIPPLTSQYLNLTKNSSLAVAIGYPDLVQVFTGPCSTRPARRSRSSPSRCWSISRSASSPRC